MAFVVGGVLLFIGGYLAAVVQRDRERDRLEKALEDALRDRHDGPRVLRP